MTELTHLYKESKNTFYKFFRICFDSTIIIERDLELNNKGGGVYFFTASLFTYVMVDSA